MPTACPLHDTDQTSPFGARPMSSFLSFLARAVDLTVVTLLFSVLG
ncbi:MAG: hypothetical protein HZY74_02820 [Brevundimonas sp.]|nr:MAG: hypothetical protein HZY74_02820 [Brevundimonas sp.]